MRKLQVLIVDDELSTVQIIKKLLERQLGNRITCETATDGATAQAMMEKTTYDLLLTDLSMPDIDGIEVLDFAHRRSPWTRAIVLTGHTSVERLTRALELGACDYLIKPIDHTLLFLVVEQHIEQQTRWQKALKETLSTAPV